MFLPAVLTLAMAEPPAEVAQRPSRVELGGGVTSTRDLGAFDGAVLVGRYNALPGLVIEANGALRSLASPVTSADRYLLDLAYQSDPDTVFQSPIDVSAWQLGARLDWGFVPRAAAGQFTGGPRLIAGLALRGIDHYAARVIEDIETINVADPVYFTTNASQTLHPVFEAGAGLDVWYAGRVGVEVRWLTAVWEAPEPDYIQGDVDWPTGVPQVFETQVYSALEPSIVVIYAF